MKSNNLTQLKKIIKQIETMHNETKIDELRKAKKYLTLSYIKLVKKERDTELKNRIMRLQRKSAINALYDDVD